MFDAPALETAVDLQQRSYKLLRWMTDAIERGFISFGSAHDYATLPEATRVWLERHHNDVPRDARPPLEQLGPFANLFASYLYSSFDLVESPGERLYSPDAHCFCPMCSWLVPMPRLQTKKVTRHDKDRAKALGALAVKQLALDLELPATDAEAEAIAAEHREQAALVAYGHDLGRRLNGVVEGSVSLALWRSFAWTPTGAPRRDFELSAGTILDAEAALKAALRVRVV